MNAPISRPAQPPARITPVARAAFTLVEVLVTMVIAGFLIAGVVSAYVQHRHSLQAQRLLLDIHGNLRAASLIISRDLALTGYGLRIPDSQLAQWINWAGVLDQNPRIIPAANGSELTLAAASRRAATLSLPVAGGSSTITVAAGTGPEFNTSNRRLIYIGRSELARVTAISGDTLTVSSHPTRNEPLRYNHLNGAPVELVQVISYWVDASTGLPVLRRFDHGRPGGLWFASVIATGIEFFEAQRDGNLVTVTLRGRAQRIDHRWTDPDFGDGFRRLTTRTQVFLRNREEP
ncbi:MAG: prepilin-type N-terminal cleavage/methylation domain-containing protein [Candidatus Marinimicrobia bacterium]|nr:prepilin-type N-terminal cleavage/methylation domain-containing protein [Candidatus Neomarinimicrobiota bacterium]